MRSTRTRSADAMGGVIGCGAGAGVGRFGAVRCTRRGGGVFDPTARSSARRSAAEREIASRYASMRWRYGSMTLGTEKTRAASRATITAPSTNIQGLPRRARRMLWMFAVRRTSGSRSQTRTRGLVREGGMCHVATWAATQCKSGGRLLPTRGRGWKRPRRARTARVRATAPPCAHVEDDEREPARDDQYFGPVDDGHDTRTGRHDDEAIDRPARESPEDAGTLVTAAQLYLQPLPV